MTKLPRNHQARNQANSDFRNQAVATAATAKMTGTNSYRPSSST